jgi:hypothetical protein
LPSACDYVSLAIARHLALIADDYVYGRLPPPVDSDGWMEPPKRR